MVAVEQLQRKLALNSAQDMTQLQSHPIAVTPRHGTPPASPEATRVHERKAGFSHGRIPANALKDPRVRCGWNCLSVCAYCTSSQTAALAAQEESIASNVPDAPWLCTK